MLMRTGRSAAGRGPTYEKQTIRFVASFPSFPQSSRVSREKRIGEIVLDAWLYVISTLQGM